MNPPYSFNPSYSAVNPGSGRPWSPGLFPRLPWLGLGALLGSVLGLGACVAILVVSNGQPVKDWVLQPTVYLSIAYTLTNIMLQYALTEGVNVAWWRRSMNSNTEVGDLHRFWEFGNSLWAALTSGRRFNLPALACVFAALAPVNGPLLQRASKVSVRSVSSVTSLRLPIAPEIPYGWTGIVSGRMYAVSLLTANFTPVAQNFYNQRPINISATGCNDGICTAKILGSGFAANCSSRTIPYDLNIHTFPNGSADVYGEAVQGDYGFLSSFEWDVDTPGNISLNVQYKSTPACSGDLIVKQCSLREATVEYPVIVDSNQSTITLDPHSTIFDDAVGGIVHVNDTNIQGPSTLGGIYLALNNQYNSSAHMRFVGAVGYEILTTGSFANSYAVLGEDKPTGGSAVNSCSLSFKDPTADLLAAARELIFRTAIASANSSSIQSVTAKQSGTRQVYESHYLFLGLALLVTLIAVVCILITFNGYWVLGRKVTMSPVEIAKAFNAPVLWGSDSNAEAKALVKEIGARSVRYGAVMDQHETDSRAAAKEYAQVQVQVQGLSGMRLRMASSETVQTPQKGQVFMG